MVSSCTPDGTCPAISAPNGEQRTYEAFAVNGVGESRSGVRTIAWAYDTPPTPGGVEWRPVVTGGDGGVVALLIEGIVAAETGSLEITSPTGETVRVPVGAGQTSVEVPAYRVGANTATLITVTPFSRFDLPPGLGGTASGAAATVSANGIGAPRDAQLTLSSTSDGDGTSTVTARGTAVAGGDGSSLRYGIVREGQRCQTAATGSTATFPGLPDGEEYHFTMCVESWWDGESFGRAETTGSVRAQQSARAPQGWTFVVDRAPAVGDQRADWMIRAQPESGERMPNNNRAELRGGPPSSVFGQDPGIQVRYVHRLWGTATPWAPVTPRAGSAPYQVQASWRVAACVGGSDLSLAGDSSNAPDGSKAVIAFGNAGLRYFDAAGALVPHTPGTWAVPPGASRVEGVSVSVNWDAQGWGLAPATASVAGSCVPNLPDPPAPAP